MVGDFYFHFTLFSKLFKTVNTYYVIWKKEHAKDGFKIKPYSRFFCWIQQCCV